MDLPRPCNFEAWPRIMGLLRCKFVAENDAALGLRRSIERHKTRALKEVGVQQ